jgi:predicted LPLAT superfamily acyltransferase
LPGKKIAELQPVEPASNGPHRAADVRFIHQHQQTGPQAAFMISFSHMFGPAKQILDRIAE